VKTKLRNTLQLTRAGALVAAAALVVAGSAHQASANIVTVGQLGTINMTAGTQTPSYTTIPIFDAGGPAVQLEFWQLALQIVPLSGATGTVTIDIPSRAYPTTSIFPAGDRFPVAQPTSVTTPPPGIDAIFWASTPFGSSYTVNSSGQSMIDLKFNASAGASGNFDVRLIQQSENTYWSLGPDNFQFYVNGVPLPVSTPGSASIGTISVAAVPEPSSLLLSGTVVGFAAWRARRKKRKAEAAAQTTGVATTTI
jgi:hypothetical protein